jgi:hypothetical protein
MRKRKRGLTADDLSVGCVLEVAVHDLLAQRQRATEALAHDGDVLVEPLVVDVPAAKVSVQCQLEHYGGTGTTHLLGSSLL